MNVRPAEKIGPAGDVSHGIDLAKLVEDYNHDGYAIVRGLLTTEEVEEIRDLFAKMHSEGVPGHYEPANPESPREVKDPNDPLYKWPRVMQPHRFNQRARHYLLHPKTCAVLEAIMGKEVVATQTMFFFKPPGARGQAMHQDQFYLLVEPGTCMAAWTAIDDCDAENGGMWIVPKSHEIDLICNPVTADSKESFVNQRVIIPKDCPKPVLAEMKAGDTLFFNGSAIHGSGPNRSKTRFRRSFIGHYAAGDLKKIARHYLPLVRMDGTEFEVEKQSAGGPCGNGWDGATH